jgi:GNAT superfamily N-acetyltransferase
MQTMVPTHIRPATAADIERIRTVIARANEPLRHEVAPALFDAYLRSVLDVEGRMLGGEVRAAEIDGRIVGTVTYFADANEEGVQAAFAPLTAGLRATAVDPDAQGSGIGRTLVEACIEELRQTAPERSRCTRRRSWWLRWRSMSGPGSGARRRATFRGAASSTSTATPTRRRSRSSGRSRDPTAAASHRRVARTSTSSDRHDELRAASPDVTVGPPRR